ncbi:hypothetical protein Aasi_1115 [Candidatus Amoebophilus asiaticus 5a2]|uniref:Sel1 domain protein repeat-containing protein n=1 Tax=Amoebophilus asiaticus (strain 5a2) TaxID=452471 RepID=B3ETA4_AMOA5|nr:hypothetical protein [Candidatus Amoebophilus asiaticus]ACE06456.1 hypothetical protein Aasi_1115 [Candidatus Amoebophilus asiaticus 5a2]
MQRDEEDEEKYVEDYKNEDTDGSDEEDFDDGGYEEAQKQQGSKETQDNNIRLNDLPDEDSLEVYQGLLKFAMEGEAEAEFRLGQRAYESWKKGGQKESAYNEALEWLEKAKKQGHETAIALLQQLDPSMVVE